MGDTARQPVLRLNPAALRVSCALKFLKQPKKLRLQVADSPCAPPLMGNSRGLETRVPDLEGSLWVSSMILIFLVFWVFFFFEIFLL